MKNVQLNFLHLCDAANVDNLGKINILGIFTKIFLSEVPSRFPKFTIVGNISLKQLSKPTVKLEIKVFDASRKELEVKPSLHMELSIPKTAKANNAEINVVLDLINLEFKDFGEHKIVIYVDGLEVGDRTFLVEQRKKIKKS